MSEAVETSFLEEEWDDETPSSRFGWLAPAVALLAVVGWTGFFLFAHQAEILAGGTVQQWSGWITAWAVPVLLIGVLWLLAMRSSSREAKRFGHVARELSVESARLEERLVTVNRELSLAREFIAAQSRDLESLGRVASERLSQDAENLSGLIQTNSAQIETIASVSTTALDNMDKLRGELPVIANSARDVTSQIGNAGRTAHGQLEELVSGFHRLNEFGESSERQIEALCIKVDATMSSFERQSASLEEREARSLAALSERLTNFQQNAEAFSQQLRESEGAALDRWKDATARLQDTLTTALGEVSEIDSSAMEQAKARLVALQEDAQRVDQAMAKRAAQFAQDVGDRRKSFEEQEALVIQQMEGRLSDLDQAMAERQETQLGQMAEMVEQGEDLAAHMANLSAQVEALSREGRKASEELAEAANALSQRLMGNSELLASTDSTLVELTDSAVRLLELIQAGASHSREQLPQAIAEAQAQLEALDGQARTVSGIVLETGQKSQELSERMKRAGEESRTALERIDAFHTDFSNRNETHGSQLEALGASLEELDKQSQTLTEKTRAELGQAIEELQAALKNTLDSLEATSGKTIDDLAESISNQSAEALDRAIRFNTNEAIGELEQAAAHASGVSREAARQLRDQLAKVDELTGNLESRVARARERAEEQVDNDFARRAALITESLNSNAIDIAKAMSNEITDTAWAAYLRGDRGIFTRRSVKLLENAEAREVASIYENDPDFREHVRRYIHDFEGMLRTMLSTRDGNALAVTLLSSDMGKLYIALAQATERLRG